jgi:hypothetical protein
LGIIYESRETAANGKYHVQNGQPFLWWRQCIVEKLLVLQGKGILPNSAERRMNIGQKGVEIAIREFTRGHSEWIARFNQRNIQVIKVVVHCGSRDVLLQ